MSGKKKASGPKAKAVVVPKNPDWVDSNMMKRIQSVVSFVCLTILSEGETTNSTALQAAMFDHYHGNASKGILSQLELFLAGKGTYANFFEAGAVPAVSSSSSSSSTAPPPAATRLFLKSILYVLSLPPPHHHHPHGACLLVCCPPLRLLTLHCLRRYPPSCNPPPQHRQRRAARVGGQLRPRVALPC